MPIWKVKTPTTMHGGVLMSGKSVAELIQKGNDIYLGLKNKINAQTEY